MSPERLYRVNKILRTLNFKSKKKKDNLRKKMI